MRRTFYNISGFIIGLGPLLAAAFIGLFVYNSLPNMIGIGICSLLGVVSLWLGFNLFKKVQIVGPIEVLTRVTASPDLDNLEPTENSDFKRRSPQELIDLISTDSQLFKGGTIRIFGNWFGKPYDNIHSINRAAYDVNSNLLTIIFDEKERLLITNPRNIFEATTYLKIQKAEKVRLEWYSFGKEQTENTLYFSSYLLSENKIKVVSNVDFYKPKFDVSISEPALMIYS